MKPPVEERETPGQDPQSLRGMLRQVKRQVARDLRDTSSLPPGLFESGDPMLEAALVQAAVEVFMGHMTLEEEAPVGPWTGGACRREHVSDQDVRDCIAQLSAMPVEPAPDLLAGLGEERLWILIDLARNGSSLGRHRATRELRAGMSTLARRDGVDVTLLRVLTQLLEEAMERGEMPVLFRTLHMAAQRGLQEHEREAATERCEPPPPDAPSRRRGGGNDDGA